MTADLPLLVKVELRGRITGILGRLTLRYTFHNPHGVPLEVTHIFALPSRAAVISCSLRPGKRTLRSRLLARREARKLYRQATAKRKTACTLEQERPDLFTLRVGPIAPGERLAVELTLEVSLQWEQARAVFCFPLAAGRRYIPGKPNQGPQVGLGTSVDTDIVPDASRLNPPVRRLEAGDPCGIVFDLTIDPAEFELEKIESRSHEIKTSRRKGIYRVKGEAGQHFSRDFVLRMSLKPATRLLVNTEDSTFHFVAAPSFPEAMVSRVTPLVILLDRSYAMKGQPMAMAREIASSLLESLIIEESFGLICFAGSPSPFHSRLLPGSSGNSAAAQQYLNELALQPACDLYAALKAAEDLLSEESGEAEVVLISSGESGDHDRLVAWAGRNDRIQIHAVGVGDAVNSGLLDRLSCLSGGSYRRAEDESVLSLVAEGLGRSLRGPRLNDLCLVGQPLLSASPERWSVHSGEPSTFHGRFFNPPLKPLAMVGTRLDGAESSEAIQVTESSDALLGRVWARAKLLDLEDRWASLPVGTVDLAVGAEFRRFADPTVAASRLRQEAERGEAWLERVQDFWRRKGWPFAQSVEDGTILPVVKAMEESSCMVYGFAENLGGSEPLRLLEDYARELLDLEASILTLSQERGVLSRFTAFLVVDQRSEVEGTSHQVVVPVVRV